MTKRLDQAVRNHLADWLRNMRNTKEYILWKYAGHDYMVGFASGMCIDHKAGTVEEATYEQFKRILLIGLED